MDIIFRQMKEDDVQIVQKIADSVIQTDFPDYDPSIKSKILREDLNMFEKITPPFVTWVALVDTITVGFITGIGPIGGILTIHWLLIQKEYQKKGIGRKLTQAYIHHAQEQGAHGVHLFSADFNVPFYEKLGFEKVGLVRKGYWGADDYFMNKVL